MYALNFAAKKERKNLSHLFASSSSSFSQRARATSSCLPILPPSPDPPAKSGEKTSHAWDEMGGLEREEEEEELLRNQSVRDDQLMYSTKLRIERKGVCVDKKVQWE